MKIQLPAALCAAIVLAGSAQAETERVVLQGTVTAIIGTGSAIAPLTSVQVGDPLRCDLEYFDPGVTLGNPMLHFQYHQYGSIEVGGARLAYTAFGNWASVGNDVALGSLPSADYFRADPMLAGRRMTVEVVDPLGQLFASQNLAELSGAYTALPAGSHLELVDFATGNGFAATLTAMTIYKVDEVGTNFCSPAEPNSTMMPGSLMATASLFPAAERLSFLTSELPPNVFALLLAGSAQMAPVIPAGSQGKLCLGGSVGRFHSLVTRTSLGGVATFDVWPVEIPLGSGTAPILAGSTWDFQVWYRDRNPGPTSNFTNGLAISFQ